MKRVLWQKNWADARWLLLGSSTLLFVFAWVRVWLTSHFKTLHIRKMLTEFAPEFVQKMLPPGIDVDIVASTAGRIAISYEEPLVMVLMGFWAVARGSDSVAGELGRGTMEMILAQPVRRIDWLLTHGVVTLLGAAVIAATAWVGTWVGIQTIELEETVPASLFVAAAFNLFSLGVFLAGLATLFSSWDSSRTRAVGLVVVIYAVQLIQVIVGRLAPDEYDRVKRLGSWSFLSAFEPQILVNNFRVGAPDAWQVLLDYNGILLVLGLVAFAVASAIFCQRDLPAPL